MITGELGVSLANKVDENLNQFTQETEKYNNFVFEFLKQINTGIETNKFNFKFIIWENHEFLSTVCPVVLRAINVRVFANRVLMSMRDDFESYANGIEMEEVMELAKKLDISLNIERDKELFRIELFDFTKYCSRISGAEYRLALQMIDKGDILTRKSYVCKMLRENFYQSLQFRMNEIPLDLAAKAMGSYSNMIEEISKKSAELSKDLELGNVDSSCFPPCIKHYVNDIKGSVNLSHLARFALVSFLSNIGMEEEKVMEIFSNVPDFSKKVTEYQVKHIMGEISGTKYSPPKCATLRSNHICYMGDDKICAMEKMNHPLTYYKIKKRQKK